MPVMLAFFLGACAPRIQPPGPGPATPALTAETLTMEDGAKLPLRVWRPGSPPRAVILALHGINDYSRAFEAPAAHWAAQGIATYAFDQRGFGATDHRGIWPGEARMIEDLRLAALLVRREQPGVPLYVLGESMGGAIVMAAAADDRPVEADGYILVAPAVWGRETQGPVQSGALWLAAHTMPWMTLTGEGLNIRPSDNDRMLRQMWHDPLVIKETRVDALWGLTNMMDLAFAAAPEIDRRALVLYGAREDVLPDSAVVAALRRLPPADDGGPQVAVYPDGYHMLLRDLSATAVLDDIAAWIADPAAPLPSGGDRLAAAIIEGEDDVLRPAAAAGGMVATTPTDRPAGRRSDAR
jgi:alpha-beta hydrolase superfamily lysophospholipase